MRHQGAQRRLLRGRRRHPLHGGGGALSSAGLDG
jgi:hypothetical protein